MSERTQDFIPAAGTDWLLPLYDPVDHLLRGGRAKECLLRQAAIPAGARVLDVGCGTGTLAILTKRQHPDAMVVGVDPDPKALALAQRKAARRGVEVTFDQGYCQELPYPDENFDVVLSSMMLHHLPRDVKRAMFGEGAACSHRADASTPWTSARRAARSPGWSHVSCAATRASPTTWKDAFRC